MKAVGGRLSHQAWLERKDRQRREEIARDAAKKKREQQEKENRAAGNNALKFSKWLAVKDKYERAVSLLDQLNAGHKEAKLLQELQAHHLALSLVPFSGRDLDIVIERNSAEGRPS